MKNVSAFLFFAFFIGSNLLQAQTITGPTSVNAGTTYSYTFSDDALVPNPIWNASPGSVITTSQSGLNYYADIQWSGSGSGTVTFKNGSTTLATLGVTITGLPAAPSTTGGSNCGTGQVTLSGTPGSGGTSVRWYTALTKGTYLGEGNTYQTPSISTTTTYYAVSYNSSTGQSSSPRTPVVATIHAVPSGSFTVTGGGTMCSGGSGFAIGLSGSATGINYQLKVNGNNTGSPVAGTGSAISFGTQTASGTYTVVGTNANNCSTQMTGTATITVNVLPTQFNMTGGGAFCASGGSVSITLTGSQTGVNYQLRLGTTNVQAAKSGTGSGLNWTGINAAGTYTIVATHSTTTCVNTMSGNAVVTSNAVSVGGTVNSSTAYFTSGSGTLTLTGHTGSVLQWEYFTGSTWQTVTPSNTTTTLNYSNVTSTTSYRAVVQNGVCAATTAAQATITIYATPVVTYSQQHIPYGGTTTLSTTSTGTYKWKLNGVYISGATSQNYTANELGDYQVEVTQGPAVGTSTAVTIKSITSGTLQNLHSTTSILQPGVTSVTNVYTIPKDKLRQTIDYQDGYGRTFQLIAVGQSPNEKDVVIPTGYSIQGLSERSYLPYVSATKDGLVKPNAIRGSDFQYNTSDQYLFYQNTPLVATDQYPYADKKLADSPLANIKEQGAPGYDWQLGNGHTAKMDMLANVATQVRHWKASGLTTGYYAANLITVSQTTDENGNKVRTFSDKMGRTILKQVQMDETLDGVSTPWLETYYIYDTYGRVKYILPPKALKILGTSGSLDANNTSVAELIHTFVYDARGRVVEKKVPGAVVQYIVYDQFDRVVLTQDGNLRASNKWAFIKYDIDNRPVYTGIYTNTTQTTRTAVQGLLDVINYDIAPWYETEGTTVHGYTDTVFPTTGTSANVILNVSYYDHYNFDRTNGDDFTYDATHLSGQEAVRSTRTRGMTTGGKRNVLDAAGNTTAYWITSAVFYDKFSRPIQTQSNNHLHTGFTAATLDKATVVYDFTRAIKTKTSHYQNATTAVHLEDWNDVDHAGRVLKTYRKINGGTTQVVAQYTYNVLGQLIDKKLHDTGGSAFLQSIDYRYNIRGWLKSINNAQLADDANVTNDETNDYFGMELVYNTTESGLSNTNYYNGNISAVKWKGLGTTGAADQRSYKYNYDKSDRLKTATFQAYTGTAWTKEAGTLNEAMTYDHNGNIKTLERKRNLRGNSGITITATPETFDNLTYTYQKVNGSGSENTDKMVKVEDGIAGAVGQSGFNNAATSDTEFGYNTDGSLITDNNKGISSITYNVLGKPQVITYSGSPAKTITYTYDAAGSKLKMSTLINGVTTTTDYAGGFVYTNNVLSFFSSPEGRIVKNGANFEYQYAIADHQGNTRVVFSSATPTPQTLTATFEGDANDQSNLFTNVSNVIPFGSANTTPGGVKVVRMNQSYKVGPSKSLRVYPGDKIDLEVRGYHENSSGYGNTTQTLATMIGAVASAFGGVSGGSGESGSIFSGVNEAFGAYGLGGSTDSQPAAYLNYIIFDTNYKMLTMGWTRVPATPLVKHTLTLNNLNIKEAGYIFVYLSYESLSNNFVYFDDMKITHTRTNVIQYNEYYPFGMSTANSWTRENTTGNNFLGNGGTEFNTTSNLYDLDYRQYDPVLGRLNGIDPMATKYASLSPYNFSFNDPVTFSDPSGADPYQRSDDTWWVAPRQSLAGGRYTGYSSLNDFLRENRPSGVLAMDDPWAWTGMSSGEIYGEGIGRFGAGYLPGEFSGTAQDKEEIWIDYYVKENGNYIDSEFKGYRYTDRKKNRDSQSEYTKGRWTHEFSYIGQVPGDIERGVATVLTSRYKMTVNIGVYAVPKYDKEFKLIGTQWKLRVSATSFVSKKADGTIPYMNAAISINGVWISAKKLIDSGGIAPRDNQNDYVGEAVWDLPSNGVSGKQSLQIYVEGGWTVNGWTPTHFVPVIGNGPVILISQLFNIN